MLYQGSCHCGQVAYEVEGDLTKVIECNCSHCLRKGYLLWFVPFAQLTIRQGEDKLQTYTFNKHVIQHRFCPVCGCAPFGRGQDKEGNSLAAVNVRCLEGVDVWSLEVQRVDGKSF